MYVQSFYPTSLEYFEHWKNSACQKFKYQSPELQVLALNLRAIDVKFRCLIPKPRTAIVYVYVYVTTCGGTIHVCVCVCVVIGLTYEMVGACKTSM